MIRVESLHARFGQFRLQDINLTVQAGSSLVVLGPSGAGKTLLLETILGLRRLESGRVLIDGRDVSDWPPERRDVSYLPQDVALFPHLSVRENILFGARVRRLSHDAHAELRRLAELLDIGNLLSRRDVRSLSGGEAQRVALARALLVRPRILFLDESFSSVDAQLRRQLQEEFSQLRRELGVTVFHVTHDQEEAFLLGDRIAVMMDGRLIQLTSPNDLYAHPASVRVARFLGISNILGADSCEERGGELLCRTGPIQWIAQRPPAGCERVTHIGFAPAEIRLTVGECPHDPSASNEFAATVTSVTHLGHRYALKLRLAANPNCVLDCSIPAAGTFTGQLREGLCTAIQVDPASVRALPDQ